MSPPRTFCLSANCPSLCRMSPHTRCTSQNIQGSGGKNFSWSVKYEREQYGRQSRTVCRRMTRTMCSCRMWTELGLNQLTHYLSCFLLDVTGAGELFGRWNKARWYKSMLVSSPDPFRKSWKGSGHETKIYASTLNRSTAVVSRIVASCNCPRLAQATNDRIVSLRAYNLSHWRRYSWFAYTLWEKKLVIICSRLQNYRLLGGTFCTKKGQFALG